MSPWIAALALAILPHGDAPEPVAVPHFPTRVHAFVFRNWPLVPAERMADVVDAPVGDILRMGRAMGLGEPPAISETQWNRTYITIIRRNWHLLPYDQLLELLEWSADELAFVLREDDFLYIKLGSLKPASEPLKYEAPTDDVLAREREIAAIVEPIRADAIGNAEPLLAFLERLSAPYESTRPRPRQEGLRMCYSYFALYGDPLADPELGSYPDGLLARLADSGVNAVWLHGVLSKLAPFPFDPPASEGYESRLENLRTLVERAEAHGIRIVVYLNEPRHMPLAFFDGNPHLKGVTQGDWAALCTSTPEVQDYIRDSIASICEAVPGLGGFFTITASENPTNCWSHHRGHECPRCGDRGAAEVIAEVNALIQEGIDAAGSDAMLIAWDWGWRDEWALDAIERLPEPIALQSVSEWSLPIERGGIETAVGEYSISSVGPGPRATRHWAHAQEHGLDTVAKIQAGNTWELSAVPYIPALNLVAQHVHNLREAGVKNIMLGWTLGGYPSPNLEAAGLLASGDLAVDTALLQVAQRRFGENADTVVAAWARMSEAFTQFPYHIGVVYNAPLQMGPANLLWAEPTDYRATMVGIPYDDLAQWRSIYPEDIFIAQLERVAEGFREGAAAIRELGAAKRDVVMEANVAEAAAIHFQSVANQSRFVQLRNRYNASGDDSERQELAARLADILDQETALAGALYTIQRNDSRIGYEATNHYFYIPEDLLEKAVNCAYLKENGFAD